MTTPFISVIMPFYNCEKYLDESISSILDQTYWNFEFIIINDASTDGSNEIIKKYQKKDKRIIYIKNEKNKWIVKNLNHWIKIARWEYIARMDGDDISMLDRFEKQISYLIKNKNTDIVSWDCIIIDSDSKKTWIMRKPKEQNKIKQDLFLYLTLIHWCAMIKANAYNKVWVYRDKYLYTEDNDWTYRALLWYNLIWANLNDIIYSYRKHDDSSNTHSKTIAKRNYQLRKEMIKEYNLKIGLKNHIWMYIHYILWISLNWKQKEKVNRLLKKILKRWSK